MLTLYETIEELCRRNKISITAMCRDCGVSRASLTDLKKRRSTTLSTETLDKLSRYFQVTIDFLLDSENDKFFFYPENEKEPLINDDQELTEMMTRVRDDPHLRMLFSITKDATAEDVEKAIRIIQALKGE